MALVTSDQFASEEEFITKVWAALGIKENDEGPGFMKDRNPSSPRGVCSHHYWHEWAAAAVFNPLLLLLQFTFWGKVSFLFNVGQVCNSWPMKKRYLNLWSYQGHIQWERLRSPNITSIYHSSRGNECGTIKSNSCSLQRSSKIRAPKCLSNLVTWRSLVTFTREVLVKWWDLDSDWRVESGDQSLDKFGSKELERNGEVTRIKMRAMGMEHLSRSWKGRWKVQDEPDSF